MPRGSRPGERRGGRQKGTPNKSHDHVAAIAERLKCDPFEVMARIAKGDLPCNVCGGKGKTFYQPSRTTRIVDGIRMYVVSENDEGEARLKPRTCLSCYGSGKEQIPPETRGRYAAELANYLQAKRKAIEVSGPEGGPIKSEHILKFVD